jgi:hypothetical protein
MDRDIRPQETLACLAPAAAGAVLTLFFFTPAKIYLGNAMEFTSAPGESMTALLLVSAAVFLLIAAAGAFVRRRSSVATFAAVASAVGTLLWAQGTFVPWSYGVLNGAEIPWKTMVGGGLIDVAAWAVVLALAVVAARRAAHLVARAGRWIAIGLAVVQAAALVPAWIAMPKDQSFRFPASDGATLFQFSRHVNVIVMLLDTFQSDLFQEIVEKDAALREAFDGFTYFRNALSGSDATSVSVPDMLTGKNYDNTVPYRDFVRDAYLSGSLPKALWERGFTIDMYPIIPASVVTDYSGVTAQRRRLRDWPVYLHEQALLLDLALFRDLPHFLKQAVYNRQRWILSGLLNGYGLSDERPGDAATGAGGYTGRYAREYRTSAALVRRNRDVSFIHRLVPAAGTATTADAFKFYHLNGNHLQLVLSDTLTWDPQDPTRDAMLRQGTGVLKIAAIFLDTLRQLRVFDNSLIFIVGDHGSGLADAAVRPTPAGNRLNRTGPYKYQFTSFKSAGLPLILAKRIGDSGSLRTSDAPVTLGDIPRTALMELGLDAPVPGESMFRIADNAARERIYRAFVGSQEDVRYFAPLYEYAVNGFSWDDASWRETGRVYYGKNDAPRD